MERKELVWIKATMLERNGGEAQVGNQKMLTPKVPKKHRKTSLTGAMSLATPNPRWGLACDSE
jgi:hypothetical protein